MHTSNASAQRPLLRLLLLSLLLLLLGTLVRAGSSAGPMHASDSVGHTAPRSARPPASSSSRIGVALVALFEGVDTGIDAVCEWTESALTQHIPRSVWWTVWTAAWIGLVTMACFPLQCRWRTSRRPLAPPSSVLYRDEFVPLAVSKHM